MFHLKAVSHIEVASLLENEAEYKSLASEHKSLASEHTFQFLKPNQTLTRHIWSQNTWMASLKALH